MAAGEQHEQSVANVADRLMMQYRRELPDATVTSVLLTARDQLVGQVPDAAFPELLHRLADYRLARIAAKR